ncbi:hypothetical protein L9F63_000729 [Diploptera punctata]|uniref:Uncharacterized protein n=1 Tax=Diploptera punctata TaxID=6984 RepID=A0AAD8ES48_DIPPU|nr:hypothetical protein L9F63_000729 [Diploptera punctata]
MDIFWDCEDQRPATDVTTTDRTGAEGEGHPVSEISTNPQTSEIPVLFSNESQESNVPLETCEEFGICQEYAEEDLKPCVEDKEVVKISSVKDITTESDTCLHNLSTENEFHSKQFMYTTENLINSNIAVFDEKANADETRITEENISSANETKSSNESQTKSNEEIDESCQIIQTTNTEPTSSKQINSQIDISTGKTNDENSKFETQENEIHETDSCELNGALEAFLKSQNSEMSLGLCDSDIKIEAPVLKEVIKNIVKDFETINPSQDKASSHESNEEILDLVEQYSEGFLPDFQIDTTDLSDLDEQEFIEYCAKEEYVKQVWLLPKKSSEVKIITLSPIIVRDFAHSTTEDKSEDSSVIINTSEGTDNTLHSNYSNQDLKTTATKSDVKLENVENDVHNPSIDDSPPESREPSYSRLHSSTDSVTSGVIESSSTESQKDENNSQDDTFTYSWEKTVVSNKNMRPSVTFTVQIRKLNYPMARNGNSPKENSKKTEIRKLRYPWNQPLNRPIDGSNILNDFPEVAQELESSKDADNKLDEINETKSLENIEEAGAFAENVTDGSSMDNIRLERTSSCIPLKGINNTENISFSPSELHDGGSSTTYNNSGLQNSNISENETPLTNEHPDSTQSKIVSDSLDGERDGDINNLVIHENSDQKDEFTEANVTSNSKQFLDAERDDSQNNLSNNELDQNNIDLIPETILPNNHIMSTENIVSNINYTSPSDNNAIWQRLNQAVLHIGNTNSDRDSIDVQRLGLTWENFGPTTIISSIPFQTLSLDSDILEQLARTQEVQELIPENYEFLLDQRDTDSIILGTPEEVYLQIDAINDENVDTSLYTDIDSIGADTGSELIINTTQENDQNQLDSLNPSGHIQELDGQLINFEDEGIEIQNRDSGYETMTSNSELEKVSSDIYYVYPKNEERSLLALHHNSAETFENLPGEMTVGTEINCDIEKLKTAVIVTENTVQNIAAMIEVLGQAQKMAENVKGDIGITNLINHELNILKHSDNDHIETSSSDFTLSSVDKYCNGPQQVINNQENDGIEMLKGNSNVNDFSKLDGKEFISETEPKYSDDDSTIKESSNSINEEIAITFEVSSPTSCSAIQEEECKSLDGKREIIQKEKIPTQNNELSTSRDNASLYVRETKSCDKNEELVEKVEDKNELYEEHTTKPNNETSALEETVISAQMQTCVEYAGANDSKSNYVENLAQLAAYNLDKGEQEDSENAEGDSKPEKEEINLPVIKAYVKRLTGELGDAHTRCQVDKCYCECMLSESIPSNSGNSGIQDNSIEVAEFQAENQPNTQEHIEHLENGNIIVTEKYNEEECALTETESTETLQEVGGNTDNNSERGINALEKLKMVENMMEDIKSHQQIHHYYEFNNDNLGTSENIEENLQLEEHESCIGENQTDEGYFATINYPTPPDEIPCPNEYESQFLGKLVADHLAETTENMNIHTANKCIPSSSKDNSNEELTFKISEKNVKDKKTNDTIEEHSKSTNICLQNYLDNDDKESVAREIMVDFNPESLCQIKCKVHEYKKLVENVFANIENEVEKQSYFSDNQTNSQIIDKAIESTESLAISLNVAGNSEMPINLKMERIENKSEAFSQETESQLDDLTEIAGKMVIPDCNSTEMSKEIDSQSCSIATPTNDFVIKGGQISEFMHPKLAGNEKKLTVKFEDQSDNNTINEYEDNNASSMDFHVSEELRLPFQVFETNQNSNDHVCEEIHMPALGNISKNSYPSTYNHVSQDIYLLRDDPIPQQLSAPTDDQVYDKIRLQSDDQIELTTDILISERVHIITDNKVFEDIHLSSDNHVKENADLSTNNDVSEEINVPVVSPAPMDVHLLTDVEESEEIHLPADDHVPREVHLSTEVPEDINHPAEDKICEGNNLSTGDQVSENINFSSDVQGFEEALLPTKNPISKEIYSRTDYISEMLHPTTDSSVSEKISIPREDQASEDIHFLIDGQISEEVNFSTDDLISDELSVNDLICDEVKRSNECSASLKYDLSHLTPEMSNVSHTSCDPAESSGTIQTSDEICRNLSLAQENNITDGIVVDVTYPSSAEVSVFDERTVKIDPDIKIVEDDPKTRENTNADMPPKCFEDLDATRCGEIFKENPGSGDDSSVYTDAPDLMQFVVEENGSDVHSSGTVHEEETIDNNTQELYVSECEEAGESTDVEVSENVDNQSTVSSEYMTIATVAEEDVTNMEEDVD